MTHLMHARKPHFSQNMNATVRRQCTHTRLDGRICFQLLQFHIRLRNYLQQTTIVSFFVPSGAALSWKPTGLPGVTSINQDSSNDIRMSKRQISCIVGLKLGTAVVDRTPSRREQSRNICCRTLCRIKIACNHGNKRKDGS